MKPRADTVRLEGHAKQAIETGRNRLILAGCLVGLAFAAAIGPEKPLPELLERQRSHTDLCRSCRMAQKNTHALVGVLKAAAVACALVASVAAAYALLPSTIGAGNATGTAGLWSGLTVSPGVVGVVEKWVGGAVAGVLAPWVGAGDATAVVAVKVPVMARAVGWLGAAVGWYVLAMGLKQWSRRFEIGHPVPPRNAVSIKKLAKMKRRNQGNKNNRA